MEKNGVKEISKSFEYEHNPVSTRFYVLQGQRLTSGLSIKSSTVTKENSHLGILGRKRAIM